MFQYAFGKYMAQMTNSELILDINWLGRPTFAWYKKRNFALHHLNISKLKYIYTPFHSSDSTNRNLFDYWRFFLHTKFDIVYKYIYRYRIIKQNGFEYKDIYMQNMLKSENPSTINNQSFKYLIGFWQSEKFRAPIADEIKADFQLWYEVPDLAKKLVAKIHSTNSVAINVRRTDFVQIGKIANMHDVCTVKYYQDAISYISEKYPNINFFVFSDDMERCRENLQFAHEPVRVEPTVYKWSEYELYMYIIWQCKHYIIPNSSFARWSVYLWRNESKTVIIPDKWFNNNLNTDDLIPVKRNAVRIASK